MHVVLKYALFTAQSESNVWVLTVTLPGVEVTVVRIIVHGVDS